MSVDLGRCGTDNHPAGQGMDTSPHTTDGKATPPCPDWDQVPFDVGCARCGHDLRGLSEPKCPACDLEFDWSEAIPLEDLTCLNCGYHLYGLSERRCPECGRRFTWEGVLEGYYLRKRPFFDYRWRHEPVRSLAQSWWLALRPWRLWRQIDIHDPPPVWSLNALLVIGIVAFALPPVLIAALGGPRRAWWFTSFLGSWMWPPRFFSLWGPTVLFFVVWVFAGFGGLMILRQSMAQCKVRGGHVLRVFAYAVVPVAIGPTAYSAVALALDIGTNLWPSLAGGLVGFVIPRVLLAALWFWTLMSIALAYRLYIRMKHAWLVAMASQAIAFLTAALFSAWFQRLTA